MFFERHEFEHRQASGYLSLAKLSTADIYDLMDELVQAFPWLGECVNRIDVTNVGQQHDLTDLVKPDTLVLDGELTLQPPTNE